MDTYLFSPFLRCCFRPGHFRWKASSVHYTVQCCTEPHYIAPHHTTLHHTTLHYTTLHHTTLHYTTLHHTTPYYTPLYQTTPHCTTPHHTALHCTALYSTYITVFKCIALHCSLHHNNTLPRTTHLLMGIYGLIFQSKYTLTV